jgi:hypothetical protein
LEKAHGAKEYARKALVAAKKLFEDQG